MDMKLLKIEALNATVFKNPFEISFLTSQQVEKDDPGALHNVCANVYLKPVSAFVGNNGSGKSTIAKVIKEKSPSKLIWEPSRTADDFTILVYNEEFIKKNKGAIILYLEIILGMIVLSVYQ